MIVVNKQQYLKELAKITLLNVLSAKGVIYTHYKNKQKRKENKQWTKTLK